MEFRQSDFARVCFNNLPAFVFKSEGHGGEDSFVVFNRQDSDIHTLNCA
jgi:hypothetical protein